MIGHTLAGRYYILELLGEGSFGQTYLAQDRKRSGNLRCVVKQLKPHNDPHTLQVARRLFKTETETLHKLGTHSQIPELLDNFEENQEFYLVQELIEGKDLSKELIPGNRLREFEVIAILQDIIETLVFIQQHKVIHRDIKPSNLMRRSSDGRIVLIDFGAVKQISTQVANSIGQRPATVSIGTHGYMPPEQKLGDPNFCSDIYAVGMIGIECLTGTFPNQLPKNADGEVIWRNQAEVSNDFAKILDKMVRSDCHKRYQLASEVLQDVNKLRISSNPPPAASTLLSSPSNLFTLMSTWTREHKIGLVGIILAVIFGVSAVFTPEIRKIMGLEDADRFTSYENLENSLKMKYPGNWDKQALSNAVSQEVVKFISPIQKDGDRFQEQVTVMVERSSNKTLDDYTKSSKQEILKLDKNAKIVEDRESTLAEQSGHRVVYTTKQGDLDLKKLQVWTLKHDRAYLITYQAEAGKYEEFLPVVEKMIKSVEVQGGK
ncbi:serine/threonine-protein kinase [Microcoleus sp. bin38.metabat.b11b12b14.051]|uniref:serine/threonine-protein kinase n=1 Tax=Microcoleus sp. bin38.metabat.b11b12b14.051 TaxID=2742709 RepID=UPI0025E5F1AB|nr:serine/threonine-protein kinase [Microcoleus sp. bin38.metabat.b11b12b14.051]